MTFEEAIARKEAGPWFPAHGGTETPVRVGEYTYLYMYQPSTRRHAYYCQTTDLFVSDEEADRIFGY